MSACDTLVAGASAGVAPALRAVDCVSQEMAGAAFGRLFGVEGALAPALTILLTLYIAFFAISLLTGRSTLGISALTPRMITLGLVLTFATSWMAYQGVVWNIAIGAPDQVAGVLMGVGGSATQIFADRIDIVFAAIAEISQAAGNGSPVGDNVSAGTEAQAGSFGPANLMWLAALLLMLGTVGVLLTARIALAVLLALGPVFVVLALFTGTRGLTAGWLRGVALTAVTPLFVVVGGSVTMELLVPVIAALGGMDGINARAAMALFVIAAVHVALIAMVLKVAGTVVAGWNVFGLADKSGRGGSLAGSHQADLLAASAAGAQIAPYQHAWPQATNRSAAVSAAASPANPSGALLAAPGSTHAGERRTVVTQVTGGGIERGGNRAESRARGIGSRFRNASNDAGCMLGKEMMR